jgi:hypothetical protein
MKRIITSGIKLGGALLVLVGPIAAYVNTFGFTISDCHTCWSEFGSAMAGIYGPIIAALTLYILYAQNKAQTAMHSHQLTQEILSKAHGRIQLHLSLLTEVLSTGGSSAGAALPHLAPEQQLHASFKNLTLANLSNQALQQHALALHAMYPKIVENWSGVYANFGGFARITDPRYEGDRLSMEFTIFATLSRPMCIALDNYHYCVTQDQVRIPYHFSPILS